MTLSKLQFYKTKIWSDDEDVVHGFFTRHGGFSKGVYAGLNCGVGSKDDPDLVQRNRDLVADEMAVSHDHLLSLYQIHSENCFSVQSPWGGGERPEGDAMVTDQSGLALGILTADCTPVLFKGEKASGAPVIGAAHAGWGGAFKGVLGNTLAQMVALGAVKDSIKAAIGPCIGPKSYEVTDEFAEKFLKQNETHERFFKSARKAGHLMFDLPGYCAARLAEAGVRHIEMLDKDTYATEEDFYSYRRTTHRGEADYGRQISVIAIKPSNIL